MSRSEQKKSLIEFKGTTLPVVVVSLRSLHPESLIAAANELFGGDAFFEQDAALLDLAHLEEEQEASWGQVKDIFKTHGLLVIGVRGGSDVLKQNAAEAGLPAFTVIERAPRAVAASEVPPPPSPPPMVELASQPEETESEAPVLSVPPAVTTMVVDRPLRSGQQVYARGGDLVVLGAVNAGAEVIADGSIHIYAPLRGRALAGASGATEARIFTTRFEAELVSIAGVYRTFDAGVPGNLAGQPVQVQLTEVPGDASSKLSIEALSTK